MRNLSGQVAFCLVAWSWDLIASLDRFSSTELQVPSRGCSSLSGAGRPLLAGHPEE
jgi:hypothetical protein